MRWRHYLIIGLGLAYWAGFVTRLFQPGTVISRVNLLDLALLVAVVWGLGRHWRQMTIKGWLAGWLALVALSSFWGAARFGWTTEAFLYIVRVSICGLFFGVAARWPISIRYRGLAWLGGGTAIIGFIQLIAWPAISLDQSARFGFDPHSGRLFALWFDPNIAAILLVLTLIGTLMAWRQDGGFRRPWPYLSGLQLLAILLTGSRSGLLSLVLALVIFCWQINRRWLLPLLAGMLLLPILSTGMATRLAGLLSLDDTATARLVSWRIGWSVVDQSPVLGVGYNYFRWAAAEAGTRQVAPNQINFAANGSDSSLLTVWATTGLIGLAVFLTAILTMGWQRQDAASRSALGAILLNSLFINSLLLGPVWFLLALIWARED